MLHASPDRCIDVTLVERVTLANRGRSKALLGPLPKLKHLECAGFSPAAVMCQPSSRPLCKCEPCSLYVHLPVLTLIYVHIYTCRPLCWCSALRGGHMLLPLSQTKPPNPSDALASARRPSVTSLMPPAHCCSLLSTHSNTV